MILGKRAGVGLEPLLEAIQHSYAGSFVADVDGPRVLSGSYDASFPVRLALKDMRLTHQLGETLNVPLVFGSLATKMLERSQAKYGEDSDTLAAVRSLEEDIGERLQN